MAECGTADPFPLCAAGQVEAESKAGGKERPATHSALTPAARSEPRLLAYQVASASLLTPLTDVAFGLETLDQQNEPERILFGDFCFVMEELPWSNKDKTLKKN
ncbi:unnamed protein product [Coccothraustes coccothraustes]